MGAEVSTVGIPNWIVVRTPSWGVQTYHASLMTLLQLWMPIDCRFIGQEPLDLQSSIELLEQGPSSGLSVGEGALNVTYQLRRLEP